MALSVLRVFCLDIPLFAIAKCLVLRVVTCWIFIQVNASPLNKFLAKSLCLLCSFHYQRRKEFRAWDEGNLVRLGNLPVKFKCFPSDWDHFIFDWIKGVIFRYLSNLTFDGSYDRGIFIDTYIVWTMALGWWWVYCSAF